MAKVRIPRIFGPQRGGKRRISKPADARKVFIPRSVRDPRREVEHFITSPFTGQKTHRLATATGRPRFFRRTIHYLEGWQPNSSWVFMVHLVSVGKTPPAVAVEFLDGVTVYYPGTTKQQYMTFKRRKSAGKHIHRHFYHRPYVVI